MSIFNLRAFEIQFKISPSFYYHHKSSAKTFLPSKITEKYVTRLFDRTPLKYES